MNKAQLVQAIAEQTNLSKKDAESALSATLSIIEETLSAGEKVQLVGFGSFEVKERAQRTGRNPSTREPVIIPPSKSPVFKAGKALKDAVGN